MSQTEYTAQLVCRINLQNCAENTKVDALCFLNVWSARCLRILNWSIVTRAHVPRQVTWAVLASPIVISADLRSLAPTVLLNPEILAVSQVLWNVGTRVTIDQFRHSTLQTFKKHRASSNIFSIRHRTARQMRRRCCTRSKRIPRSGPAGYAPVAFSQSVVLHSPTVHSARV